MSTKIPKSRTRRLDPRLGGDANVGWGGLRFWELPKMGIELRRGRLLRNQLFCGFLTSRQHS